MPKTCPHMKSDFTKDAIIVVGVIIAFLMLREVLSWMLKTNHAYGSSARVESRMNDVIEILNRNGLR